MIFLNDLEQVLLFLRNNDPTIPYPNMWEVLRGHVEKHETPEACIVREIKEELDLDLQGFDLLCVAEFSDRIEHTFWKLANLDIAKLALTEGQWVKWFTQNEIQNTELAGGFNQILRGFFARKPLKVM